jgi:hypothetical protein
VSEIEWDEDDGRHTLTPVANPRAEWVSSPVRTSDSLRYLSWLLDDNTDITLVELSNTPEPDDPTRSVVRATFTVSAPREALWVQ